MIKEEEPRRPSSATTSSTISDTVESHHSRAGSRDSSTVPSAWTRDDDEALASARASGMNWQPIAARFFPTKSANACRKRHERLMEKRYEEEWEQDRLEELASAYFECRKDMWAILGERLGERWSLLEGKCMEKGLKNLQTLARASQRKRVKLNGAHDARSDRYREEDSGVGLSDTEIELSHDNRPASAPVTCMKRRVSTSPVETRRRLTELPLYRPPPSASYRSSASAIPTTPSIPAIPRSAVTASVITSAPSNRVTTTAATSTHREVLSIQSILSPAD